MKRLFIGGLLVVAMSSWAQTNTVPAATEEVKPVVVLPLCDSCATVDSVRFEKRKGTDGTMGAIGGALVGGLLGNQIGKGTGRTVATVGGVVAGGVVGNQVQKSVSTKDVWITAVRLKDGSIRLFEQEAQPAWASGNVVRIDGSFLTRQ